MSTKIMICEDDNEIRTLLTDFLEGRSYDVISAVNGVEAVKLFEGNSDTDMILLDLMLPLRSGDLVLSDIRKISDVPVIVVSAKDLVSTKIDLMRLGADDYVTKPFDLDELLVRIETVLRRARRSGGKDKEDKVLSYKNINIDTGRRSVTVNGSELLLAAKDYEILVLLLKNKEKIFSKSNIYESIWKERFLDDDNIIKVHMSGLRSKLKELDPDNEYIETIWGMGYRLKL